MGWGYNECSYEGWVSWCDHIAWGMGFSDGVASMLKDRCWLAFRSQSVWTGETRMSMERMSDYMSRH